MLIPNNPDIDFVELNRRIESEVQRYQQDSNRRPLPPFNPAPPHVHDQPYAWSALIQLDDEALVKAAFPSLVGRKAKASEAAEWLAQLRSGTDRFEFLATLRYSVEGKRQSVPVQGLRRARIRSALRRTPVLGKLLANAYGWIKTDARHRYYMARFDLHSRQLEQQSKALSTSEAALLKTLETQQTSLIELQTTIIELQGMLAEQHSLLGQHYLAQQEMRSRLSHLERNSTRPAGANQGVASLPNAAGSSVPDSFYLAFENRFRGDAETIRSRLAYYLPIISDIAPLVERLPLVDIGCGRGEWLKMLPDATQRIGIDLNSMNVQACHEQGLEAVLADGLVWLSQQPDETIAAVTAFHVIEHLSFEQLNTLLDECMRVLAPGGMVIFETPNPENLVSAATHFHTDPTHLHPLPPAFSEFMLVYKGFTAVQVHRLNPIPSEYALVEDSEIARRCNALFYGAQDYAVTAQKSVA
ncbi:MULTISPECIES: class I SAM-dependent methyltransferase [Gammaproteobacteria]|uniref:class I SAM-dependent methyltransferase n=1 Tax=Gammaproteobacteria TaxID=1236 RepID=UPI003A929AFD